MNRHDYSQRRGPLSDLSPYAQLEDPSMADDGRHDAYARRCMEQGGFPHIDIARNVWVWPDLERRSVHTPQRACELRGLSHPQPLQITAKSIA